MCAAVQAISELVGFAASLDHDAEVHFVAGGESQFATWLAAFISRTAVFDQGINVIQEETIWEHLLRQAGLNAFAAQYILWQLKAKDGSNTVGASSVSGHSPTVPFGLAALVRMTDQERMEMFGQVVGQKVMARMSKALDGRFTTDMR